MRKKENLASELEERGKESIKMQTKVMSDQRAFKGNNGLLERNYLNLIMELRINKQTAAGIVTNEMEVHDEAARVILLVKKNGLNCRNENERGKSNQLEGD